MRTFNVHKHKSLIVYCAGSAVIAIWTILRFVTQRTIFDLVGQQVIAQQIIAGHGNGAAVGITNYLFKLFFLYIPLDVLPGSSRLKLMLLTIIVNVASFILIGILLAKILREFGVRIGTAYYAALLWLSMVAGSVFWIEFTNSRNLEVAGGLLLIWLSLRFLRQADARRWAGLAALGAVLFFADNLQLYMTAIPVLLYSAVTALQARAGYRRAVLLAAAILAAIVGSKLLFLLSERLLQISFADASTALHLSVDSIKAGAIGTIKAYGHLLLGGADAGRLREVLNGVMLLALSALALGNIVRRRMPARLAVLIGCILVVNTLVFIVSSSASQGGAERYLIMTVPALMLAISGIRPMDLHFFRPFLIVFTVVLLINIAALGSAVVQAWPALFSADRHTALVVQFTEDHSANTRVYASMDAAIPGAYLSGSYKKAPLPFACRDGKLFKTNLFYAKEAYKERESQAAQTITVILDGDAITNTPSVCTKQSIESQLGNPVKTGKLTDGSAYLVYPASVTQELTY